MLMGAQTLQVDQACVSTVRTALPKVVFWKV